MSSVGPIKETHVPVIFDSATTGFGGPVNMDGPVVGSIEYTQPFDNLHLHLRIEYAYPNTKYEVFLVAGPSHALATGYIAIGSVATNAVGAGSAAITVAHATLLAGPFGAGFRNDHIDILLAPGDLSKGGLTAGAINYFVCAGKELMPATAAKIEAYRGASGTGDPHGPEVKKQ